VVVADNDGVTKVAPVPTAVPPVAASYHLYVPVHPDAVKVTVPSPHRETPVLVGAPGIELMVTIREALGLSHPVAVLT
jgi:hypothetical protein